MAELGRPTLVEGSWAPPASIDDARARARDRFKSRLQAGEAIGECGCGDDDEIIGQNDSSPPECVVGVRFPDSGRIYYFRPGTDDLRVGDWVVVPTNRGQEAARVVMEQHHVRRAQLRGDLGSVVRRLNDDDVSAMETFRRERAGAIKTFGEISRAHRLGIKAIAADYTFDGSAITLSYSVPDRERAPEAGALRDLAREAASVLGCRVELRQIGPRDEARLLGGLGRCGRTLCCSSWLPVFPEISMSMAKNQDLPLNPAKVSGVCGRLLCCLSYENDQYRQMKAVMPKLGQTIDTPGGVGQVVSMQLLKELVTVRLEPDNIEATFSCDELGLGTARGMVKAVEMAPPPLQPVEFEPPEPDSSERDGSPEAEDSPIGPSRRRRRRRSARRGNPGN